MKFSGVMALELTQFFKISTLSAQKLKQFSLFVGIISCPSLLTNLKHTFTFLLDANCTFVLLYGRICDVMDTLVDSYFVVYV